MSFFSRLSDIVSCQLDDIVNSQSDPRAALIRIIGEIEEGLHGAQRSVNSASASEERLQKELTERRQQAAWWGEKAREELAADHEDAARQALLRRKETEDLVAGIEQQLAAALSTRLHLTTTMRAIEARLAEAHRIQQKLNSSAAGSGDAAQARASTSRTARPVTVDRSRAAQIEAELDALRKELGKG